MIFDPAYIMLVLIPSLVLSLAAQAFVRGAYSKWGRTANSLNISGVDVAQRIMRQKGYEVRLEGTPGELSDHYDPGSHTVRMSQGVASKPSVAAMAIVAHEFGHVEQHVEKSSLIQMRSFLVPAMRFSPTLAYGLIFAGLIMNVAGLMWLGILFFGVVVFFMLLTLPVEFDASRRGLRLLEETGLLAAEGDRAGARQMLTAAALTYVAAFVSALLTLLYYVSLASRRN